MKIEPCSSKNPIIWVVFLLLLATLVHGKGTRVGFYSTSCPEAETIVTKTVTKHLKSNPRIAPGLVRLQFHDCSLRGCDASVLIEGPATEKTALQNSGINGYDVINDAKTQLEAACPNVVSCADIIALAARDSVVLTGGRRWGWEVPTGRRDGRVSLASETSPKSGDRETVTSQLQLFSSLGLNTQDLVVLVGSHTIGTSSCGLLTRRLYNFTTATASGADPAIDPSFVRTLRATCPQGGPGAKRVELDHGSGSAFDTSYFDNLRRSRGILESDQFLWADPATKPIVARLLNPKGPNGLDFAVEFGRSMVKMSNVGVKISPTDGEIRRVCTAINY